LSSLALYFHTVRHLRPIQIAARAWFRLHRPPADLRVAPATRTMNGEYAEPIAPAPSLVGPDNFRFLNCERRCTTPSDWQPLDASKLWIYNLHYFEDLNARDAMARVTWHKDLLVRWTAENPPGRGDGWEPYPLSRRIVNCVKWALRGNAIPESMRTSLAVQTRWLTQRLEYHILGNHLIVNAKALLHAGLYFDGAEAERWCARAMHILTRELREQVLVDGGHVELSTMYQAAILEDLLDLVNLLRAYGRQAPLTWVTAISQMQRWLRIMSHPDGEIAFFNDAAFGMTPTFLELESYASRLGLPLQPNASAPALVLEPSGYVRICAGAAYLLCDCAPVGADYQPGHAHADSLSFELSVAQRRVFVNSGTSQYGTDAERERQRGTAAHNTVVVDGKNSSEVWAGFRVARRARVTRRPISFKPPVAVVDASHDGYRRLPGSNMHRRRWTIDDRSLCIEDEISGRFATALAYLHIHPAFEARVGSANEIVLNSADDLTVRVTFTGAAAVQLLPGTWHPRFGVEIANHCIVARFSEATLTTSVVWAAVQ
jgi:uncharacterized heparinase superfamily protein